MPTTSAATLFSYAASAATVYSAVASASQSNQSAPPPPPIPIIEPPKAMPSTDQSDAKRASITEQLMRRGRASTILSDIGADKLGAG